MSVTRADRRIITFYSFKGGVGRSMALANVAFRLAVRHALRVIVVDWDLEAPGLHDFFGLSAEATANHEGLLDYLLAWREAVEEGADAPPDATRWLIPVTNPAPAHGSLSLLLAGRLDDRYADRLRTFDWQPFYRFSAGAAAIETLRAQLSNHADIVLIDSRTGVTDAGGVCTVQMPDGVVLMTAANEQSFAGIERVAQAIIASRKETSSGRERPKVWVAVARAPYLDVPKHGDDWFDQYSPRFEQGYSTGLWDKADHPKGLRSHRFPHFGRWGFGEQLIGLHEEDNGDPLANAYGAFTDDLVQWVMGQEPTAPPPDLIQLGKGQESSARHTALPDAQALVVIEELRRDVEEAEKRHDLTGLARALRKLGKAFRDAREPASAVETFQRAVGIYIARGDRAGYASSLLSLGLALKDMNNLVRSRQEFVRAREIFRELGFGHGESLALAEMAGIDESTDPNQADVLFRQALTLTPSSPSILGNYARFLLLEKKDPDSAERHFKLAIAAAPTNAVNLGNYANFLWNVRKDADAAETLFRRAMDADPNNEIGHLGNYAAFVQIARRDLDLAEHLYKKAIAAHPNNPDDLGRYATFLWQGREDLSTARELFESAINADPGNSIHQANFAGLLLALGDRDRGLSILQHVLTMETHDPAQLTECWYYQYSHGPQEMQSNALARLKRLLARDNARSPGWNFSRNIERARMDNHPQAAWLTPLAHVIAERAELAALSQWPAWESAELD